MAEKSILIFGAGKIGRSFIGQLFGKAGYQLVFVDMDHSLVRELNRQGSYPVLIKGPDWEERLLIKNVRAIFAPEKDEVAKAIGEADILAISVGKTALPALASTVASGLIYREQRYPGRVLDIILAENMRSADLFLREKLREHLPSSYPLDKLIGLVETSIGKMVPIMSARDVQDDPLQVFAEPYNTLILDRKGFLGEIPSIAEFSLKENMKAWVDRKAFVHNLGHATAAYYGYLLYSEATYMFEILADPVILRFTRTVMEESATILRSVYPGEYSSSDLSLHIEDLLVRFQNRNLGDTIYRVGSDLRRKLGSDDRFMGIIRKAIEHHQSYHLILEAMAMGFHFKAVAEDGQMFPGDLEFHRRASGHLDLLLTEVCGLDLKADKVLITNLKQLIKKYHKGP